MGLRLDVGLPALEGAAGEGGELDEVLCVQEERQVGNDSGVSINRLKLLTPQSPLRAHFVKARVKARHCPDGAYAIFRGPRRLGRCDRQGEFEEQRSAA